VSAALFRAASAEEEAEDEARRARSFASISQRMRWRNLTVGLLGLSIDSRQRFASANALEARFPFLDWDLVSLLLAIPIEHWPVSAGSPRIHREALEGVLPPRVYNRRTKAEFTPALANRVSAQMGTVSDLLEGSTWLSERWVNRDRARRLLASFRSARAPDLPLAYGVWAIATVEAWLRSVLLYTSRTRDGGEDDGHW
jgi:asparagine synthetase B (glutamine-hydrolysing)